MASSGIVYDRSRAHSCATLSRQGQKISQIRARDAVARSRLCRSRFLKVRLHIAACFNIYNISTFLHSCKFEFCRMLRYFEKIVDFNFPQFAKSVLYSLKSFSEGFSGTTVFGRDSENGGNHSVNGIAP